ncbi:MAG: MFS transporter [Lentisphaerota bacterium]
MSNHDQSRFRVGTLVYSRAGLVTLFAWLLWGDFVYTLMENVMPHLLPLVLRDNGVSNQAIAFIVSSIFMVVNAISNPIISYKSDRFRSRWGRRRPFILATTPFVVILLALIPFSPEITRYISGIEWITAALKNSPITAIVLVSGVLVVAFQIFNMFVSSVYYYLIADVVPEAFIGRFYGLFRVFGSLAALIFNYFIFGMAQTHMQEIFIGIALFYGFFITLMCLQVKEGEYPPPDKKEAHGHWWSGIRNYAVECFGHRIYLLIFVAYGLNLWSGASAVFNIFFVRDLLGLSLDEFGKMSAYLGVALMVIIYPLGILIDRWGSHKSIITACLAACAFRLAGFFLINDYWTLLTWTFLIGIPTTIIGLAIPKWLIDLYPRERYGQFGSASAMTASIGAATLGPLCGLFFDFIKDYRYVWLWPVIFHLGAALAALLVYREWKSMGGRDGYSAP